MKFRVVRTNQYNQDLGHIHSTNGNHLESPNEGSSIDHQVTIYLHAQNITMFPTNETRCEICVARDSFVVIVAQKTEDVCLEDERVLPSPSSPCCDLLATMSGVGFPGYSAGRGVDPAGGAPGGVILTSSLLITASSNRNADVITADHSLLSADNADVIVSDSNSSLLLNNLVNSN
ncbi:hypothetical protein F511_06818 [Dorcoceras hygrometricum]|uniref:Uncharacterized protein n=1 Tax=Dorcoceras hygrometricum TaxID=472368 RepID=A0A2Z7CV14_9LAMI|nr:hypothetical protein F511_06818 [Dorcoceras hygrometricum]